MGHGGLGQSSADGGQRQSGVEARGGGPIRGPVDPVSDGLGQAVFGQVIQLRVHAGHGQRGNPRLVLEFVCNSTEVGRWHRFNRARKGDVREPIVAIEIDAHKIALRRRPTLSFSDG